NRNGRTREDFSRVAHVRVCAVSPPGHLDLFANVELVRLVKGRGEMIKPQMARLWREALVAGALAGTIAGCGDQKATDSTIHAAPAPDTRASQAAPAPAPGSHNSAPANELSVTAPLIVEHQVDVTAQREGVVAKISADTGTRVGSGTILA